MKRKILGIIAGWVVLCAIGILLATIDLILHPRLIIDVFLFFFSLIIAAFVAGYIAKSYEIITAIISLLIVFLPSLRVQINFVKAHGLEKTFSGYPTIIGGYLLVLFCASFGGLIAMIIRRRREREEKPNNQVELGIHKD